MIRAVFAIPGDIATRTGGYIYDRRVMDLLPGCGIDVMHLPLPGSFPHPSNADLDETRRLLAQMPAQSVLIADGLAWGVMPIEIVRTVQAPVIALCHHPLGLEAGLTAVQSAAFISNERAILALAQHVIVTSGTTAETLIDDFGVPRTKISVAEPGTDPAPRARGSVSTPVLLAVGSIVPRKGYDVLVEALTLIADLGWRLVIAGSPNRAPGFAADLLQQIFAAGLNTRIELAGELDDETLSRIYNTANIFVSASHYEGFGMVLTEALAYGLPIVTTTGGAAALTTPDSASVKVPPGDPHALAAGLKKLLLDEVLRAELADHAWAAAASLPRWQDTAAKIAAVIRMVAANEFAEEI